jgi:hypothetical protein
VGQDGGGGRSVGRRTPATSTSASRPPGLLPDRDGWGWFLAAADGLGVRQAFGAACRISSIERRVHIPSPPAPLLAPSVPRGEWLSRRRRCPRRHGGRCSSATCRSGQGDFLDGIGSLLEGILPRLGLEGVRPSRDRSKELGIAWTAHELKGPLAGARAALDRATDTATVAERRGVVAPHEGRARAALRSDRSAPAMVDGS